MTRAVRSGFVPRCTLERDYHVREWMILDDEMRRMLLERHAVFFCGNVLAGLSHGADPFLGQTLRTTARSLADVIYVPDKRSGELTVDEIQRLRSAWRTAFGHISTEQLTAEMLRMRTL